MASPLTLSIVIVTYNREQVLVDTISHLLLQARDCPAFRELLVVDQTQRHEPSVDEALKDWSEQGAIRWARLAQPNLTQAMNFGLCHAHGEIVLFVDDDIIPGPALLDMHLAAHSQHSDAWAVVGQVLQPGERAEQLSYIPRGGRLRRYMDFPFRRTEGAFVENAMAGNLSVVREKAITIGGFDENFPPPVAARFESEFAKRLVGFGGKIWFEPSASILHLQATTGGTRSRGSHLSSASPIFGVGDYYFALRQGQGWEKWWYILRKPFREVRTRFHLRHPWWIPVKLLGELRAFTQAFALNAKGPQLLKGVDSNEYKGGANQ